MPKDFRQIERFLVEFFDGRGPRATAFHGDQYIGVCYTEVETTADSSMLRSPSLGSREIVSLSDLARELEEFMR